MQSWHQHNIYILRHGETVWNAENRLQGRLDSQLTPSGEFQAREQGRILKAILPTLPRVRVSPAGRARRTAELALSWADLEFEIDDRLAEIDLGDLQGKTLDDVAHLWPDLKNSDDPEAWKFDAPGGEGLASTVERCGQVLAGIDGPTILVTHGITSRVLRCLYLGHDVLALSDLPGGQGNVHHLYKGRAQVLSGDNDLPPSAPI